MCPVAKLPVAAGTGRNSPSLLYAVIRDAGAGNGLYKSDATGATWKRISNAAMDALMTDAAMNNARIAIHDDLDSSTHVVYVGIIRSSQLAAS